MHEGISKDAEWLLFSIVRHIINTLASKTFFSRRIRFLSEKPAREGSWRVWYEVLLERLTAAVAPMPSKSLYSLTIKLNSYSWPCRYFKYFVKGGALEVSGRQKSWNYGVRIVLFLDSHRTWAEEPVQLCCHHVCCCSKTMQELGCFPWDCCQINNRTGKAWLQKISLSQREIALDS